MNIFCKTLTNKENEKYVSIKCQSSFIKKIKIKNGNKVNLP